MVYRLAALAGAIVVATAGCGLGGSTPAAPPLTLPSQPVELNVLNVCGCNPVAQQALLDYSKAHPRIVSKVTITAALSPDLPSKLKRQENSKWLDVDLVLTGYDGVATGLQSRLYRRLLPDYSSQLGEVLSAYSPPAAKMRTLANGYALPFTYTPSGPLLEYQPAEAARPPSTPDELLAWARDHPGRFTYARPSNSGPGRTLLMGLPYLLGDRDPRDPVNGWARTWAYLKQLDQSVDYYPGRTGQAFTELASGQRALIATTMGWDINQRALGSVPRQEAVQVFSGEHWIEDGHFLAVPAGIESGRLAVVLDVIRWMLQPAAQALTFDQGYLYPGPARSGVTVDQAPAASQQVIRDFGRSDYDAWIRQFPVETPLDPPQLFAALDRWDRDIGAQKIRT